MKWVLGVVAALLIAALNFVCWSAATSEAGTSRTCRGRRRLLRFWGFGGFRQL
jgi:hypothetical protein